MLLPIQNVRNQKCKIQRTLINLSPNKYNRELHYYPFVFNLDKRATRITI